MAKLIYFSMITPFYIEFFNKNNQTDYFINQAD